MFRTEFTENTEKIFARSPRRKICNSIKLHLNLKDFNPFQLKHSELTSKIIGICISVHKTLGPGLLESIYESAICIELSLAGLTFKRQQGMPAIYNGINLELGFRADVVVENTILLEIKSIESVAPVHKKVILSYLRLSGIEIGLLINFNVMILTDGITRLILDKKPAVY